MLLIMLSFFLQENLFAVAPVGKLNWRKNAKTDQSELWRENIITTATRFEHDRNGFESYLGYVESMEPQNST